MSQKFSVRSFDVIVFMIAGDILGQCCGEQALDVHLYQNFKFAQKFMEDFEDQSFSSFVERAPHCKSVVFVDEFDGPVEAVPFLGCQALAGSFVHQVS